MRMCRGGGRGGLLERAAATAATASRAASSSVAVEALDAAAEALDARSVSSCITPYALPFVGDRCDTRGVE